MNDTKPFGTFFLPGPTEVRAAILTAMTGPMIPPWIESTVRASASKD